jgi:hypothetical protein
MTLRTVLFLVVALTLATSSFASATITIRNTDTAGVGFNDTTPATPVGGNPGTTVGEQRMNAFREAARIWSEKLDSPVEILIDASFAPLTCSVSSATLGSAGPTEIFSDFPHAPQAGVWYPFALANKLAGENLDPGHAQIRARFNGNLGNADCLASKKWYYGLDGVHSSKQIDLVVVLLHEFAHGLGVIGGITVLDAPPGPNDPVMGSYRNGKPFIYDLHALDDTTGLRMDQQSDTQRSASMINDQHVVWDGAFVTNAAPQYLGSVPKMTLTIGGSTNIGDVSEASFGPKLTPAGVNGTVIPAIDAAEPAAGALKAGTQQDGCSAYTNAGAVNGNVALVSDGRCSFVEKAKAAQAAGASALLIADTATGSFAITPVGSDSTITIPVYGITKKDGDAVRAAGTASLAVFRDLTRMNGANQTGRVKLYTPTEVAPGSTYSHIDTSAFPNALMEPNISSDLSHDVDLTLPLLLDIGWGITNAYIPPPGRSILRRGRH